MPNRRIVRLATALVALSVVLSAACSSGTTIPSESGVASTTSVQSATSTTAAPTSTAVTSDLQSIVTDSVDGTDGGVAVLTEFDTGVQSDAIGVAGYDPTNR